jgi:hypothetical protein
MTTATWEAINLALIRVGAYPATSLGCCISRENSQQINIETFLSTAVPTRQDIVLYEQTVRAILIILTRLANESDRSNPFAQPSASHLYHQGLFTSQIAKCPNCWNMRLYR